MRAAIRLTRWSAAINWTLRSARTARDSASARTTVVGSTTPTTADAKRAYRSARIVVEHEFTCGEWVVARQQQQFTTIAPPERRISVRGVSLFRVVGERIVEWYDYYDATSFARQMAGK